MIDLKITAEIKQYASKAATETQNMGAMILAGFLEGVEVGEWRITDPKVVVALRAAGLHCETRELAEGTTPPVDEPPRRLSNEEVEEMARIEREADEPGDEPTRVSRPVVSEPVVNGVKHFLDNEPPARETRIGYAVEGKSLLTIEASNLNSERFILTYREEIDRSRMEEYLTEHGRRLKLVLRGLHTALLREKGYHDFVLELLERRAVLDAEAKKVEENLRDAASEREIGVPTPWDGDKLYKCACPGERLQPIEDMVDVTHGGRVWRLVKKESRGDEPWTYPGMMNGIGALPDYVVWEYVRKE